MEKEPILMDFQQSSFNGDTYINQEFLKLKEKHNLTTAIETGSCLYVTTKWLGENFDTVHTVEINEGFAKFGRHRIESMPNVNASINDSVLWLNELVSNIILPNEKCIFFLDAHWNNHCPLLEELSALCNIKTHQPPVIVIHDFYTGKPELGYDEYHGQPFTYEWIKPFIDKLEQTLNCKYAYYYNENAVGAMRGVIYLYPASSSINLTNTDQTNVSVSVGETKPIEIQGEYLGIHTELELSYSPTVYTLQDCSGLQNNTPYFLKINNILFDSDLAVVDNRVSDGSAIIYTDEGNYIVSNHYIKNYNPNIGGYLVIQK